MTTDASPAGAVIQAAGALVWRGDPGEPQVAIIHRPRYDDWSFPKGKQDADESLMATALREIREEIGATVRLGPPLPTQRYVTESGPKVVTYWAAECITHTFVPSEEVDEIQWLDVDEARSTLTRAADVNLLDAFVAIPRPTVPAVALRHAKAVPRSRWHDPDQGRPLTPRGEIQAAALSDLLREAYGPVRLVTSPWRRCVETLEPYARRAATNLVLLDVLGEEEFDASPNVAVKELSPLIASLEPIVFCSHGNVMPAIIDALVDDGRDRAAVPGFGLADAPLAKGEFVVVHRAYANADDHGPSVGPVQVVAVERHHPTEALRVRDVEDHDG